MRATALPQLNDFHNHQGQISAVAKVISTPKDGRISTLQLSKPMRMGGSFWVMKNKNN
jgi:hypothetical protein